MSMGAIVSSYTFFKLLLFCSVWFGLIFETKCHRISVNKKNFRPLTQIIVLSLDVSVVLFLSSYPVLVFHSMAGSDFLLESALILLFICMRVSVNVYASHLAIFWHFVCFCIYIRACKSVLQYA